jgi:imidazolonepropionase-like amidohydrolase
MRMMKSGLVALLLWSGAARGQQITVRAGTLIDGKGKVLHNTTIVIEGSKIIRIDPSIKKAQYDFPSLTVMPGWIDTHTHISTYFNRKTNKVGGTRDDSKEISILAEEENAYLTMMGGFTTVQSPGVVADKYVREFDNDPIPLPRILTSLQPIMGGTPEEIRAKVDKNVADGADFIKLFATKSIREGGAPTLTQEQVDAACGEAKKLGKRTIVHAQGPEGAKMAILAGCTSIEHGNRLTDEVLDLMVQHGTYFDPNFGLLLHNYIENKDRYMGNGNFDEAGFEFMEKGIPVGIDTFHRAMAKHVKIIFGTDGGAGAHGRNAEEMIYRVRDGGQPAADAITDATSHAAESLGLGDQIGSIGPGMQADIIATDGNPISDITNVRRVVFVMKAGKVYKNIHLAPGESSIVLGPNGR